jgi:hypothetical protein
MGTYPEQNWAIEAAVGLVTVCPKAFLLVRSSRDCDRVLYGGDFGLVDSFRLLRSRGWNSGRRIDDGPASYLVR